jgi:hypothetical protein
MSTHNLPYSFREYQGTRWHRRLVSGELILQFDQYPEREVIIDHIAEQESNKNNDEWKSRIRTICTADDDIWNQLSPGKLLELIRKERTIYFPEAKLHWRSSSFTSHIQIKEENKNNALHDGISDKIKITVNKDKKQTPPIFVFPDIYDVCPLDEQIAILIAQYRAHATEVQLLSTNSEENRNNKNIEDTITVCLPETHKELAKKILQYQVKLISNPTNLETKTIKEMSKDNSIILCADVWYTLAFLKRRIGVHSFLDRREWFASVVLHDNIPDNSPSSVPNQSKYGELLHADVKNNRALREYHYLDRMPLNGVEADLSEKVVIPQWVEQSTKDTQLTTGKDFYTKQTDNTWVRTSNGNDNGNNNTVHVSFAFFKKDQVMMEPVFFAGKHSPLALSYPDGGFFTSFNYYFTENLKSWYANNDKKPLPWDDFMLDYLAFQGENGLYESVPLYNKALLGYGKDGTLFACEGRWKSITLTLDEKKTFVFKKEDNPNAEYKPELVEKQKKTQMQIHESKQSKQEEALGIGTINKNKDSTAQQKSNSEIHFPSDNKTVGEGLWCLTFIHDYLWKASKGPVKVPPFGVVVTTKEKIEHVEDVSWSVEWQDLPMDKSEVAWMAGGFNLLVKNRKNLVTTPKETHTQMNKEGWFTPSSLMTQETALDVEGVQPRSVIGYGGDTIIVMSVSGRNSKSKGITFGDAASLAIQMTEKIKGVPLEFLLNLDGGASSVLGCKKDGEGSCLLSKPSPTITNPAGCPRCVPSLLTIMMKSKKKI